MNFNLCDFTFLFYSNIYVLVVLMSRSLGNHYDHDYEMLKHFRAKWFSDRKAKQSGVMCLALVDYFWNNRTRAVHVNLLHRVQLR